MYIWQGRKKKVEEQISSCRFQCPPPNSSTPNLAFFFCCRLRSYFFLFTSCLFFVQLLLLLREPNKLVKKHCCQSIPAGGKRALSGPTDSLPADGKGRKFRRLLSFSSLKAKRRKNKFLFFFSSPSTWYNTKVSVRGTFLSFRKQGELQSPVAAAYEGNSITSPLPFQWRLLSSLDSSLARQSLFYSFEEDEIVPSNQAASLVIGEKFQTATL